MPVPAHRQDRDSRGGRIGPQPPDELDPIHYRHHDVGDHQVRRRLTRQSQSSRSITGFDHIVAGPLENPPEQEPLVRFVVDHQDAGQSPAPVRRERGTHCR
jgi:hypothetical protein